jgi:hypothetical protein
MGHSKQPSAMLININPINPQERLIRKGGGHPPTGRHHRLPDRHVCTVSAAIFSMNKRALRKSISIKQRSKKQSRSASSARALKNISRYAKGFQLRLPHHETAAYRAPIPSSLRARRWCPKMMLTKSERPPVYASLTTGSAFHLIQQLGNPIISTSAALPDGDHRSRPVPDSRASQLDDLDYRNRWRSPYPSGISPDPIRAGRVDFMLNDQ